MDFSHPEFNRQIQAPLLCRIASLIIWVRPLSWNYASHPTWYRVGQIGEPSAALNWLCYDSHRENTSKCSSSWGPNGVPKLPCRLALAGDLPQGDLHFSQRAALIVKKHATILHRIKVAILLLTITRQMTATPLTAFIRKAFSAW